MGKGTKEILKAIISDLELIKKHLGIKSNGVIEKKAPAKRPAATSFKKQVPAKAAKKR